MRPDIVLLDPPRKGSDEETLSAIAQAEPERIVYISCNVSTLARDAAFLREKGYVPSDLPCGNGMFIVQTSFRPTYRGRSENGRA